MVNYIFTCKLCGKTWFATTREEGWKEAETHFRIYHPDTTLRPENVEVAEIFGVSTERAVRERRRGEVPPREPSPPWRFVKVVCRECGYTVVGRDKEVWREMVNHAEKSHRKTIRELRVIEIKMSPFDYQIYKLHNTLYKLLKKLRSYLKDPKSRQVIEMVAEKYTEALSTFVNPQEAVDYLRVSMPDLAPMSKSLADLRRLEDAWRTAVFAIDVAIKLGYKPAGVTMLLTMPDVFLEDYTKREYQSFIRALVL
jgi:predicted small metal-binding protein